jgi:hypothetical protein
MGLSIAIATILDNKTVQENASSVVSECTAVDGSIMIALGIEVLLTFHALATLGATVKVFTSADGTNYTTNDTQEYDIPVSAGATVRHSFTVANGHKYYKIQVTNLDTAQDITALYVYSEPQLAS